MQKKTFFFKLHSGTLPVRTFVEERRFYMPWGSHFLICNQAETIYQVFPRWWEGVYIWSGLQMTIKKQFPLHPHEIRYLPIENDDGLPFYLIMVNALHII